MAEKRRKKRVTPYEKAVRYLSQVEDIDMMIGEKQDIIDSLRSSITGTSAGIEGERVQTFPKGRLGGRERRMYWKAAASLPFFIAVLQC